jgi:menaquinone-dependent protoporphyrinogen oxidase
MGGTAGIAEEVAATLRTYGFEAVSMPAAEVRDLKDFDAAVIGGALYAFRWHKDARRLVRREGRALSAMPLWLFSSGPLDDSAVEKEIPPVRFVQQALDELGGRSHRTFGGRLPADADWFPASAMAKKAAGDWRDMGQVRAWADKIAAELTILATGANQEAPGVGQESR